MKLLKHLLGPEPLRLFNFLINEADRRTIQRKAKLYARGNVSAWIRYASIHLEPRKEDLAELKRAASLEATPNFRKGDRARGPYRPKA